MAPLKSRPKTRKPKTREDKTDTRLVREYIAGDERAFTLLYERYYPRLMRFLVSWVKDKDLAQDLVQEAFLRVHRHITKYKPQRKFSTWIFMISANLAKNAYRNKGRSPLVSIETFANEEGEIHLSGLSDTRFGPDRLMNGREAVRAFDEALRALPYHRRRMFILRRIERMDLKSIAKTMKCPVGTVKSNVNRAGEIMRYEVMRRIG